MNELFTHKAIITFMVLLGNTVATCAQSDQKEVEVMQEVFGLDKEVTVDHFIERGEDAQSFCKIYDEYGKQDEELGVTRFKVIAADDKRLSIHFRRINSGTFQKNKSH